MRRAAPVSRDFGFDRGVPIDRYYIEKFLLLHAGAIAGNVLEIGDDTYSVRFGRGRVTQTEILDLSDHNARASIVADLTSANHVPSETFDCIVLTQTLHLIFDCYAATQTLYRILKPGGVLLATMPGISKICSDPEGQWKDQWRFTSNSCARLFGQIFPPENITTIAYGNVLSAVAFLEGLATRELTAAELDHRDAEYEVIIGVRAMKDGAPK